jgi:uncharacterized glyoxalase superfamily protein PhnB
MTTDALIRFVPIGLHSEAIARSFASHFEDYSEEIQNALTRHFLLTPAARKHIRPKVNAHVGSGTGLGDVFAHGLFVGSGNDYRPIRFDAVEFEKMVIYLHGWVTKKSLSFDNPIATPTVKRATSYFWKSWDNLGGIPEELTHEGRRQLVDILREVKHWHEVIGDRATVAWLSGFEEGLSQYGRHFSQDEVRELSAKVETTALLKHDADDERDPKQGLGIDHSFGSEKGLTNNSIHSAGLKLETHLTKSEATDVVQAEAGGFSAEADGLDVEAFSRRAAELSLRMSEVKPRSEEELIAALAEFEPEAEGLRSVPAGVAEEIFGALRFVMIKLGDWCLRLGRPAVALLHFKLALSITSRRVDEFGVTPESLRDVSVSLQRLGDFDLNVQGDTTLARARYEESIAIQRRIVDEFGETPQSLRDVSVSLQRLGDFDIQVLGDTNAALARYEECLIIQRRIVAEFGETPESLRDVSVSLNRLGDIDLRVRGDTAAALARYEEGLIIQRRIVAEFGETPELLRDISVSLSKLGDFDLQVRGDTAAALARYEEWLAISRRIVAEFGETPQSLRDVSVSLNKLGDFDLDVRGDTASALGRYEEDLAIARRIVTQFGETPQSLRDVSVSLDRLGDLDLQLRGDTASALAQFDESLLIRRRIVAEFGETPQSLRDVSVSLNRLGDFDLQVRGDTASALARYEECLFIHRRIVAEFGETPQSLRDLGTSLEGKLLTSPETAPEVIPEIIPLRLRILQEYGALYDHLLEATRTFAFCSQFVPHEKAIQFLTQALEFVNQAEQNYGLRPGDAELPDRIRQVIAARQAETP